MDTGHTFKDAGLREQSVSVLMLGMENTNMFPSLDGGVIWLINSHMGNDKCTLL